MKKLVCASEIKAAADNGKKIFHVDEKTIVTAAASDLAKELGVEIVIGMGHTNATKNDSNLPKQAVQEQDLNRDVIYEVVKAVLAKTLMANALTPTNEKPFHADGDAKSGLKIVRGRTVKMENFDTGNPSNNVAYREVISKDESQMSAGFLTIEKSSFEWELCYEEIDIILEGCLSITIDGETYHAYQGDVLFVPKGSKVIWGASEYVKLFYATYPANWADLMAGQ